MGVLAGEGVGFLAHGGATTRAAQDRGQRSGCGRPHRAGFDRPDEVVILLPGLRAHHFQTELVQLRLERFRAHRASRHQPRELTDAVGGEQQAARPQHAEQLAECAVGIGHEFQRLQAADHIEGGIGEGQLRGVLPEIGNSLRPRRGGADGFAQHVARRIQQNHPPAKTGLLEEGARQSPRARRHIEQQRIRVELHGAAQRQPQEPLLVAGIVLLDAVVEPRGAVVEEGDHPPPQIGPFGDDELPVEERRQRRQPGDQSHPGHPIAPIPSTAAWR